jgi:hypothetical protein
MDEFTECYRRAMDHAKFLLHVELDGKAVTCNPHFEKTLGSNRTDRMKKILEPFAQTFAKLFPATKFIDMKDITTYAENTTNPDAICGAIHDVMRSYYDITRSRFVDNICVQVVDHFLLSGEKSPLRVLSSDRVLKMTPEELDMVAGEEAVSKSTREMLNRSIAALEEAKKILKT